VAKKNLTDRTIAALKPAAKRIDYFDTNLPGFGLRVTPNGIKSFTVLYRRGNVKRRYTIGKYPGVNLVNARELAKDIMRGIAKGHDPQTVKAEKREAATFADLATSYMDEHSKPNKSSWREDQRMFDNYLLPKFKYLKAGDITQDDCEALLEDIANHAPVRANRVRALLRHLYAWTLEKKTRRRRFAVTQNPCAYIPQLIEENPRDRTYSDKELKALWKAFEAIGTVGSLFKLQLLTAARKGELAKMGWSELDLDRAVWTQPGAQTKNRKLHVVPLSPQAVTILEALKQGQSTLKNVSKRKSAFVFCSSRTGRKPMAWLEKAAERVRVASKVEDFQAHDLRRTTATRLAEAGAPDAVLKMILNHSLGKDITGVYNQYKYFEERKALLAAWGKKLSLIVSELKTAAATVGP
jgi:integrase